MAESQTKSTVSGRVPPDEKEALANLAYDRSTPIDRVTISELVGEAVSDYIDQHADEIPDDESSNDTEEARAGAA